MPPLKLTEDNKYLIIERLAMMGLTQRNLADFFGVDYSLIQYWFKQDPMMREAWERGRVHPDHLVEQALFRRAVGYQYLEVHEERGVDGRLLKKKVVKREMPPEPIAQFFWLKNRLPHLWQDTIKHEVTVRDLMELGNKHRDRNLPDAQEPKALPDPMVQDAEFIEVGGTNPCVENPNDVEMVPQENPQQAGCGSP